MYDTYIMKRTQIYLEADQDRRLARRATASGVTKSTLIREAIETYLAIPGDADKLAQFRAAVDAVAKASLQVQDGESYVETIRAALPPEVLVKWTEPIKAVSTMLLCMSLGVDRFNCDVDQILSDAKRAEWLAPLTIPAKGLDY